MMEVGGLFSDFDAPRRLPAEYLRKLQELQDRVPAFPTDEALRRVEASLGLRNFTDVFTLLVDEPVRVSVENELELDLVAAMASS